MKYSILLLALLSSSAHSLDLTLPADKQPHPWAQEKPERARIVHLSNENYLSNGSGAKQSISFGSNGISSFKLKGQQSGIQF